MTPESTRTLSRIVPANGLLKEMVVTIVHIVAHGIHINDFDIFTKKRLFAGTR